jgi:hypothetical protein
MAHSTFAKKDAYNNMADDDMTTIIGNNRVTVDLTGRTAIGGDFMPSAHALGTEFVGEDYVGLRNQTLPPMLTPGQMADRQHYMQQVNMRQPDATGATGAGPTGATGAGPTGAAGAGPTGATGAVPNGAAGAGPSSHLVPPMAPPSAAPAQDARTVWKTTRLGKLPGGVGFAMAGHPAVQNLLDQQFAQTQASGHTDALEAQQIAQLGMVLGQLRAQMQQQKASAPAIRVAAVPAEEEGGGVKWWIPVLIAAVFAAAMVAYAIHKGWLSFTRHTDASPIATTPVGTTRWLSRSK